MRRGVGQRRHGGRRVDEHAHRRRPGECREPRGLRCADDFVGDQHVADSGVDECRGFVGLLAADADGAAGELCLRDRRALVRFGVRPQPHAFRRVRHALEVALERLQVDEERRRLDRGEGVAGARRNALHQ